MREPTKRFHELEVGRRTPSPQTPFHETLDLRLSGPVSDHPDRDVSSQARPELFVFCDS